MHQRIQGSIRVVDESYVPAQALTNVDRPGCSTARLVAALNEAFDLEYTKGKMRVYGNVGKAGKKEDAKTFPSNYSQSRTFYLCRFAFAEASLQHNMNKTILPFKSNLPSP
ncbi:hypothetical protein V6N11_035178 [Hibiscus sabdariffa]|uniref:Uncharacterized protein n=1 Tax=Hibiscus sabdariffa TaxID=183260 RepID=A0ABR2QZE9_9ROSI